MTAPFGCLELLLVHAEGEIGKVIMHGAPSIPGNSVLDKLVHLNEVDDKLRRFCTLEPRGMVQASVNLLLEPVSPGTDAGFIVMQPDRCHAMSGSNAICVTTALLESGRVADDGARDTARSRHSGRACARLGDLQRRAL